ncbi:hypothetical protein JHK87_049373 [Glycine soja]|nr:hypothetical protein JHK87_049373 [Glycine soja]
MNGESKKEETIKENPELDDSISDTDSENLSTSSTSLRFQPWITDLLLHQQSSQPKEERTERSYNMLQSSTTRALLEKFSRLDREAEIEISTYKTHYDFSGNVRELEKQWHYLEIPHLVHLPYVQSANTRLLFLENLPDGSAMLNWSLQQVDFQKPISWQKDDLDLFTEGFCQMDKSLLSSNINWLVLRVI